MGGREVSSVHACCPTEVADENHVIVLVSDFADGSSGKGMRFYENAVCAGHHATEGVDA